MNGLKSKRGFEQASECLPKQLRDILLVHRLNLCDAQEIRLRINRPLSVVSANDRFFFNSNGSLCTDLRCSDLILCGRACIDEVFQRICDYSVYSKLSELKNGFVTIRGGHRAGVCGTAVTDGESITNVTQISSINIRVAGQKIGCAQPLRDVFTKSRGVMICGPPCSGKTTVLRDLARLASAELGLNVSLIDERGELAACVDGEPQNDVGMCDVFNGFPKAQAVLQALRSMSPDVIMCDEIGASDDAGAVKSCARCGVSLVATAHAADYEELMGRRELADLVSGGDFSTLVFLEGRSSAGRIKSIFREGEAVAA